MTSPLKISNLVKKYGDMTAVDNVSFEMKPGEIFGLLGPNGAGKTSIISCIVTLEQATAGEIQVYGKDVVKDTKNAKAIIGFVPQELINHGYFNVEEILHFHSGYYGHGANKERIDYLLHKLALYEHKHKKVKSLSGGMKRRLLIAKALVHNPKILLLDEPTAGVDIELRTSLWEFVEELRKEGLSILLTTHYLEEAEQLCDRVGILQKGVLKRIGPTAELIQELTQREISITVIGETAHLKHSCLIEQNGQNLKFRVPTHMGVGDLINELKLDLNCVQDLNIKEGSLEDAFLNVLGGDL